jgi:sulfate/thiosulfate transport system permease protein
MAERTNTVSTYARRVVVITYVVLLVAWPVSVVVKNTFADGLDSLRAIFADRVVTDALIRTGWVAAMAVVANVVFGVGVSLLLVRYRFRFRRVLSVAVDLPLSVSPIVIGLALVLVYNGRDGWFGPTLERGGIEVLFAAPSVVLATIFVSLPLVVREVVPVLEELGDDQEQAARSLGASAWQTFGRITLPSIRWAVVYGVVLSFARSLGEFGAVKIVSGNVIGRTQTAPLVVEQQYQEFQQSAAYATAFVLGAASIACIIVVTYLRPARPSTHKARTR